MCVKEAVVSGVRPGTAAPRGGTASRGGAAARSGTGARSGSARGANRAGGEERALTSVAAGDRFRGEEPEHTPRLWHVTLSVSGARAPLPEVRRALEQLAHDHPFLLTSRYADDHAEIRYWEEARDLHDAAAVALRLWGEHRQTAGLPPWEIVGLEVIDRATYHQRIAAGYGPAPATPVGVHPF
ncbi:hypothetical protein GUR47_09480 [Streptomyces tendae]|uniref:Uncharacterized protein n=1 Tax=Streptomyces tendae TaxID=1932 RepID=A0A6B3QG20_STRTE|nr:hypothetical protein [Streptomyces sp. RK74B]MBQ1008482.1 hypothetical protein [Streptomyces sp. RK23]NEV86892.1 hypothetical protein [Streptomyces tendae]